MQTPENNVILMMSNSGKGTKVQNLRPQTAAQRTEAPAERERDSDTINYPAAVHLCHGFGEKRYIGVICRVTSVSWLFSELSCLLKHKIPLHNEQVQNIINMHPFTSHWLCNYLCGACGERLVSGKCSCFLPITNKKASHIWTAGRFATSRWCAVTNVRL